MLHLHHSEKNIFRNLTVYSNKMLQSYSTENLKGHKVQFH